MSSGWDTFGPERFKYIDVANDKKVMVTISELKTEDGTILYHPSVFFELFKIESTKVFKTFKLAEDQAKVLAEQITK